MKSPFLLGFYNGKIPGLAMVLATGLIGAWLGSRSSRMAIVPGKSPAPALASVTGPRAIGETAHPNLPENLRGWISELGEAKPLSTQSAAAVMLVSRLAPEDWPLVLRHLGKFPSSTTRSVLKSAVVRRWAAANPAGAADWGLKNDPELAAAAAGAWVRRDVKAAGEWFEGLRPNQRKMDGIPDEYFGALLKVDFAGALASIRAHANDEGSNLAWGLPDLVAADPDKALQFSGSFAGNNLSKSIREEVAREFGRQDPFSAIDWALRQEDPDKMLWAVFQQPHQTPVAGLIPALASLPPEKQKEVLDKSWPWWERGDPFDFLEALRKVPESLSSESRRFLMMRALVVLTRSYQPQEAARLMQSDWKDFSGQWETVLASDWTTRDSEAARAWIERLPEGPVKEKALQNYDKEMLAKKEFQPADPTAGVLRILSRMDSRSFSSGGSLLTHLDSNQRQELWDQMTTLPEAQLAQAQQNFMTYQAASNPDEAASWLGGQPASPANTQLVSQLAANWALDDAPAAAVWAGSLPAGEAKTWALWNLARQWQRVNAGAAQRWAEQQPGADRAILQSAFAGRRPQ